MKATHDGLTLWYGTPDAPAPPEEGASRSGLSLTVATRPPNPLNGVSVTYRVDGGIVRTVPAGETWTDYASDVQYFRAAFPTFTNGSAVEYAPVLTCGGRQAPSPSTARSYSSRFQLSSHPPAPAAAPSLRSPGGQVGQRFLPEFEFIASVTTRIANQKDVIGETPEGIQINYYLAGGEICGPRINGVDLPRGGDLLTVRRDGIAVLSVRCVYMLDDGVPIGALIPGWIDLGPDGYAEAARGNFPDSASLWLAPNLYVADGRYQWINRSQFVGLGRVSVPALTVTYDIFAVRASMRSNR